MNPPRDELEALRDADALHLLPDEALIASIKWLAERLLSLMDVADTLYAAMKACEVGRNEHGPYWHSSELVDAEFAFVQMMEQQ